MGQTVEGISILAVATISWLRTHSVANAARKPSGERDRKVGSSSGWLTDSGLFKSLGGRMGRPKPSELYVVAKINRIFKCRKSAN